MGYVTYIVYHYDDDYNLIAMYFARGCRSGLEALMTARFHLGQEANIRWDREFEWVPETSIHMYQGTWGFTQEVMDYYKPAA